MNHVYTIYSAYNRSHIMFGIKNIQNLGLWFQNANSQIPTPKSQLQTGIHLNIDICVYTHIYIYIYISVLCLNTLRGMRNVFLLRRHHDLVTTHGHGVVFTQEEQDNKFEDSELQGFGTPCSKRCGFRHSGVILSMLRKEGQREITSLI